MLSKILKSDPMITYNHMQDDGMQKEKSSQSKIFKKDKLMIWFIAEELIIALLLALIFYMI